MNSKFSVIILMAVFCVSCNNVANKKTSADVKDSVAQKAPAKASLPDISGVYRLPENGCDLVITFIKSGDGFKYYIKGSHLDVEGKAVLSVEEDTYYITFDGPTGGKNKPNDVSGVYKDNTLTIQNYGNAQNQYNYFEDCQDKYLEFKKQ